ncbi:MAG: response regulator [bacterium]
MSGRVFLVEDDRDVLEYYEFLLVTEGFTIWASETNGRAAIARFREADTHPDAVILDHRLPGCNGDEVARALLAVDPAVRILYVTADDQGIEAARALGIRRLKRKPCSNERLLRNLEDAILERRRQLAAAGAATSLPAD